MPNLQSVVSDLKFRAILHFRGDKMMCPSSSEGDGLGVKYGVMKFALPIIRNYPKLKMKKSLWKIPYRRPFYLLWKQQSHKLVLFYISIKKLHLVFVKT